MSIDSSRQRELDSDPEAIQQIEFVKQLKKLDSINTDGAQSMFISTISDKSKK